MYSLRGSGKTSRNLSIHLIFVELKIYDKRPAQELLQIFNVDLTSSGFEMGNFTLYSFQIRLSGTLFSTEAENILDICMPKKLNEEFDNRGENNNCNKMQYLTKGKDLMISSQTVEI